jgi:hypothetical protein
MTSLVRFGLCLLLATKLAWAGPFEDGIAAFEQQDYAAALTLWLPLAERGDRAAQFNLGVLYEKGLGVPQDAKQAAKWYLLAAQQGDTQAQYNMGVLHQTGTGLAQDLDEARKWYRLVMANPSTDSETLKIKQQARARLATLTSVKEDVVPYAGGRFVIARSPDGACVVGLQGAVTRQGISRFDDVIQKSTELGCANPWLLLESPGGLLFDALDLGLKVRRAGFRTIARASCASACALIFLGGTERTLVGSDARIGFHQPARGGVCDPTTYTSAAHETSEYLRSVIPAHADEILNIAMKTSCKDIEWISGQRAVSLGIATSLEWEGVAVRPMRRGESR